MLYKVFFSNLFFEDNFIYSGKVFYHMRFLEVMFLVFMLFLLSLSFYNAFNPTGFIINGFHSVCQYTFRSFGAGQVVQGLLSQTGNAWRLTEMKQLGRNTYRVILATDCKVKISSCPAVVLPLDPFEIGGLGQLRTVGGFPSKSVAC